MFHPFRFCGSEGLSDSEGFCGAGYYCALGASSPVPADETNNSVGGLCATGYACVGVRKNRGSKSNIAWYARPSWMFLSRYVTQGYTISTMVLRNMEDVT